MYKEMRCQIVNQLGLHARAAAKFVKLAARFSSEICVTYQDSQVNGKSIMGIMMLGATHGGWLELTATGHDSDEALLQLSNLIQDRFGEPS